METSIGKKKGYGKQQLLLVLDVDRNIKILNVRIVCDKDNIASVKTALSCSGILISENIYDGFRATARLD